MSRKKHLFFAAAVLCLTGSWTSHKIGFHWYPAGIETSPGTFQRHDSNFMDRCGKARITSIFGDPVGSYDWPRCKATMKSYGTYEGFLIRHNVTSILSFLGLLSGVFFVNAALNGKRRDEVVRGRKLFTGKQATHELNRLSKKECRASAGGACGRTGGLYYLQTTPGCGNRQPGRQHTCRYIAAGGG